MRLFVIEVKGWLIGSAVADRDIIIARESSVRALIYPLSAGIAAYFAKIPGAEHSKMRVFIFSAHESSDRVGVRGLLRLKGVRCANEGRRCFYIQVPKNGIHICISKQQILLEDIHGIGAAFLHVDEFGDASTYESFSCAIGVIEA